MFKIKKLLRGLTIHSEFEKVVFITSLNNLRYYTRYGIVLGWLYQKRFMCFVRIIILILIKRDIGGSVR
jgi:hypothetical protein